MLKDAARANFKVYKFKEGSSEEIKRHNQDLRHNLLRDDVFHHKVCRVISLMTACANKIRIKKMLPGSENTESSWLFFKTQCLKTTRAMASRTSNISTPSPSTRSLSYLLWCVLSLWWHTLINCLIDRIPHQRVEYWPTQEGHISQ